MWVPARFSIITVPEGRGVPTHFSTLWCCMMYINILCIFMDRIERYLYGTLNYRTPSTMEECITVSKASQYIMTSPIVAPKVSVSMSCHLSIAKREAQTLFITLVMKSVLVSSPFNLRLLMVPQVQCKPF